MAKSGQSGENRSRRAADKRRAPEAQVQAAGASPATADDRGVFGQRVSAEEIARRAYEIYAARGGTHGYDIDDWLQAERELRGK